MVSGSNAEDYLIAINFTILGQNIRKCRLKKHYTQRQLNEIIGMHDKYLSNIECAKSKPSLESVVKISVGLQVPIDFLLEGAIDNQGLDYPKIGVEDKLMAQIRDLNDRQKSFLSGVIALLQEQRDE